MFTGIVLIAALAVTGLQRRSTVKAHGPHARPEPRGETEACPSTRVRACAAIASRRPVPVRRGLRRRRARRAARRPIPPPPRPASPPPRRSSTRLPRGRPSWTVTGADRQADPRGKKIVFVSCGVEACAVQGPILRRPRRSSDGRSSSRHRRPPERSRTRSAPRSVRRRRRGHDAANRRRSRSSSRSQKAEVQFVTCCAVAEAGKGSGSTPRPKAGALGEVPGRRRSSPTAVARPTPCTSTCPRSRSSRRSGTRSRRSDGVVPGLQRRKDRHPGDRARKGRAGPHRLLPAQPPE